jgi:hypothetical protein
MSVLSFVLLFVVIFLALTRDEECPYVAVFREDCEISGVPVEENVVAVFLFGLAEDAVGILIYQLVSHFHILFLG